MLLYDILLRYVVFTTLYFLLYYVYIYRIPVATEMRAPRCITEVLRVRLHGPRGGVFVGHRPPCKPPLYVKKKRYQKFYICSDAPGQSRVNPERQEEEKSGHKRWVNGQNSAGGEQTDLQNPTTHYRRARGIKGIIRNQWG